MAISTTTGGALVQGVPPTKGPKTMAEVQVVLTVGKITSKGAFMAGDIVPLPEAEAKDFIRRKWAKPATADAPPVVDAPQVENREDDVAAKTSKRAPGRPRKDKS